MLDAVREKSRVYRGLCEALDKMVDRYTDETKDKREDIASDLGCSASHFSNVAKGTAPIPMDLAVRLTRMLDDSALAQKFCEMCGGMFISKPRGEFGSESEVIAVCGQLADQSGQTIKNALAALADGVLTDDEFTQTIADVDLMIRACDHLRRALQEMPRSKSENEAA